MTQMKMTIEGRKGALTMFRVIGGAAFKADAPSDMARVDGDDLVYACSKKDLNEWQVWVDQANSLASRKISSSDGSSRRVLVEAGTVRVGETLPQGTVTGLGRIWVPNPDTFSANGISPSADYVQYAYID